MNRNLGIWRFLPWHSSQKKHFEKLYFPLPKAHPPLPIVVESLNTYPYYITTKCCAKQHIGPFIYVIHILHHTIYAQCNVITYNSLDAYIAHIRSFDIIDNNVITLCFFFSFCIFIYVEHSFWNNFLLTYILHYYSHIAVLQRIDNQTHKKNPMQTFTDCLISSARHLSLFR